MVALFRVRWCSDSEGLLSNDIDAVLELARRQVLMEHLIEVTIRAHLADKDSKTVCNAHLTCSSTSCSDHSHPGGEARTVAWIALPIKSD